MIDLSVPEAVHLSLMVSPVIPPHLAYHSRVQVSVGYVPPVLSFIGHRSLRFRGCYACRRCVSVIDRAGNLRCYTGSIRVGRSSAILAAFRASIHFCASPILRIQSTVTIALSVKINSIFLI